MMRILELFAGYGSQALALEYLGIHFESDISEIDKYAIDAYNQIHGQTHNWGDITKIDETKLPYYDLITYSSPCQDFSVAGLQRGGDKDSGTRSSLLWECERIIRAVKPKYLLMENVKNLVGKKHKHNFVRWLNTLEMMGYQNFWKVLNAKDYGVPQNRERVFVVSILGCGQYLFPNPIKLEKRLKDILEPVVDEKYYIKCDNLIEKLKDKQYLNTIRCGGGGSTDGKHSWDIVCIGGMQEHQSITTDGTSTCLTSSMGQGGGYVPMVTEPLCCASRGRNPENPSDRTTGVTLEQRLEVNQTGCSNTITTVNKDNYLLEPKIIQVGNIGNTNRFGGNPNGGRVYDTKGICACISTMQGGGLQPKILDDTYANRAVREYNEFSPTIRAEREGLKVATDYKSPHTYSNGYRIRKLPPRECWRLMGVRDEDFNKLHGISNTQLYKMAGNSIVVDVLMGIFKNLFLENDSSGQLSLF